jgi:hypothetical protein
MSREICVDRYNAIVAIKPKWHSDDIDKPMKGHNLMQAIARVNRVFKGKLPLMWLKLSVDEIAFYRALVENESSVRKLGKDNLRKLAIEQTNHLRKSATVDWQKRESVRAGMRNLVRRLLRRWKYPQDAAEKAIQIFR